MIKHVASALTVLVLAGCQSYPPTPNIDSRAKATEAFSIATLQEKIKKGSSTKADVLLALGTPNIMTMGKNGSEVYVWEKRSQESESAQGKGRQVAISSERNITISITFGKDNLVSDIAYRVTSF